MFATTRGDWRAARVVMVLAVVGWFAGAVAPPVWSWLTGGALVWTSRALEPGPAAPERVNPGVTVTWADQLLWTSTEPTVLQRLASVLVPLLTLAVLVVGVRLVWGLLDEAQAERPFGHAGVRRIRLLGALIGTWALAAPLLRAAATMFLVFEARQEPAVYFQTDLAGLATTLVGVAAGLLVVLLGEVYARGSALAEDTEGLV